MWNGKNKAFTFSFDDGMMQDVRVIEILNKYRIKGTFNINSGLFGTKGEGERNGYLIHYDRMEAHEIAEIYRGHEVAVHTCTHPRLNQLTEEEIVKEVVEDQKTLSALVGYPVVGMAYPYGLKEDREAEILAKRTDIRYSRTTVATYSLKRQTTDLLRYHPTMHFSDSRLDELADEFLSYEGDEERLFYVWGHSFELDAHIVTWEAFEQFCKKISGKSDVFYGTNREVLL